MNAPIDRRSADAAPADALRDEFEREIAKYPPEQKAVGGDGLPGDRAAASTAGSRSESEDVVAEELGMPPIAVHEVTTFYNMYNQKPVGRFKLNVCTNLPCQLRGGQHALEHLCATLGVDEGGTTADGALHGAEGECLGACADAPVMLVNDQQMCSFMSDDQTRRAGRRAACADGGERGMNADARSRPLPGHRPARPASTAATSSRRSTPASTARTGA